jgi:hypothetical protein
MTDPPGGTPGQSRSAAVSNRSERNSLSGKNYLPRHSARSDRVPAHIGEALPPLAKGDPEGSPSDPVTTDPKGEAGRLTNEVRAVPTCNTPALITTRAAYGDRVPLDPWFVSGLAEGGRMLLRVLRYTGKAADRARGPTLVFAFAQRDGPGPAQGSTDVLGCGWIRESKTDRTFRYEARAVQDFLDPIIPHFERYPSGEPRREALGRLRASAG